MSGASTNMNGVASLNIGSTISVTGILDEDDMTSDSAVKICTQQSIKKYVDDSVAVKVNRITANTTLTDSYHTVFCNTDGGAFTVTLPAGVSGREYQITNTGSSGNSLTITPNGTEQIFLSGAGTSVTLYDGEGVTITYETTDYWN